MRWDSRGSTTIRLLSLSRPRGTFFGGVFLPDEKALTGRAPIEVFPSGETVFVPMLQHDGLESTYCVEVGVEVRQGDVIGRPEAGRRSAHIHAPVDGRVKAVTRVETPHACDVRAVEIEPAPDDGLSGATAPTLQEEPTDWRQLVERVREAGIAGTEPDGSDAAELLAEAGRRGVRHVIVSAMESEPYLTSAYRMLVENGGLLLRAADLVGRLLGTHRLWLAVDRAHARLARQLYAEARGLSVRVQRLRNKYPQGAPPLLVRTIVRREIPYGGRPLDVSALVLDAASVFAIGRAVYRGTPCTSRIITVAGEAASRPGNYEVPVGLPIRRLVEHVGLRGPAYRLVVGGPMTGATVSSMDTVVTKRVGAVMLLSEDQVPRHSPGPCVRCGWCLEDCPVGLDPPSILAAAEAYEHRTSPSEPARRTKQTTRAEAGKLKEIASLFPHACLGCGICTYVCPAGLPLAEGLERARTMVPAKV